LNIPRQISASLSIEDGCFGLSLSPRSRKSTAPPPPRYADCWMCETKTVRLQFRSLTKSIEGLPEPNNAKEGSE